MSRTLLLALSCLAMAAPVRAQAVPALAPGARVRVMASSVHSAPLVGTLRAVTPDTIVLDGVRVKDRPAWRNQGAAIPIAAITRLEVSRGRHRHMATGAGLGFVVGAVAGGVLGALQVGSGCPSYGCETSPLVSAVIGGAVLGGVGALVGLGIGAATTSETWEDVPIAALRADVPGRMDPGT